MLDEGNGVSEVSSGVELEEKSRRSSAPIEAHQALTSVAWTRPAAMAAFLLVLAAVWLGALLNHAGAVDRKLFSQIYGRGGGTAIHLAQIVTRLGSPEVLYVMLAIAAAFGLLRPHQTRGVVLLMLIVLTCRLVVTLQKAWFALPRPHPSLHHVTVHTYAFPSGHAANSMATYLALALILAGSRRPPAVAAALIVTFAVGISRIVLGVHWPSDVIGGWTFGCFWTVGGLWLADRFNARLHHRAAG
jgi:undecaprenyl-diphosphatase